MRCRGPLLRLNILLHRAIQEKMIGDVTPEEFKAAMGSFPSGVTVVTTIDDDGTPWGLTATAFSSVSLSPPLCLVCVARTAEAHPVIVATRRFAVNVLSEEQRELSARFAISGADKFSGVGWSEGVATRCPFLDGCLASIECGVVHVHPAGDHDLLLGELKSTRIAEKAPLLYFRGRYGAFSTR